MNKMDENFYVKVLNTRRYVYLFDDINNFTAEIVCTKLRVMNFSNKSKPIYLEINSGGGSVTDGFAIIDTIKMIKAPVYTIINGVAASMAGLISIMGAKRFITPNATWMEHSTSDLVGDYLQHIKDRTTFLVRLEKRMNDLLKQHTQLTTHQMTQIKNGELWLFADEVIKYGIADKIIDKNL